MNTAKLKRYLIYAAILFVIGFSVLIFWPIILLMILIGIGYMFYVQYKMKKAMKSEELIMDHLLFEQNRKKEKTDVIIDAEFTEKDREDSI